ncbi:hypothetical protein ACIQ1J_06880 [Streptomyces sp. NPDC097107]|uniref:hypothetical protein n=1 Tax=Streptomyces sp. NPDC097107 TaxID=3366089 RepID=UPI003816705B
MAAPFEFLFLGLAAIDNTGLRGLSHWQTLKYLSLGPALSLDAEDWAEIARLPLLTALYLNASLLPGGLGR